MCSILCWISLVILLSYILLTNKTIGTTVSLSQTYYKTRTIFTLVIGICNLLILPKAMFMSGQYWIIPWIGTLGMIIVGLCPDVNGKERKIHILGATLGAIFGQIWSICFGSWFLMLAWLFPLTLAWKSLKETTEKKSWKNLEKIFDEVNLVYWVEMTCYFILYGNLILK